MQMDYKTSKAVEIVVNLLYLIEQDADDPRRVRDLCEASRRAVAHLIEEMKNTMPPEDKLDIFRDLF